MECLVRLLLLVGHSANAEVLPHPGLGDPHIQYVEYDADQVVALNAIPGFAITVELSPDERIENIAIGNGNAWQVQTNHRSDKVFIKPVIDGVPTNMTVITDLRRYSFVLRSSESGEQGSPYAVRFTYPGVTTAQKLAEVERSAQYKLSGKRTLWPTEMSDNGQSTEIHWAPDTAMPAVYKIDDHNEETLVNGTVMHGVYVVQGVAKKFVFRRGRAEASATRIAASDRR